MTRKKAPSEFDHQAAFFAWCELRKVYVPELDYIFAIPNGIKVSIGQAVKLKRSGVKRGVVDVFVSVPTQGHHGYYFDFKIKGNDLTADQREWLAAMLGYGYKIDTFYDWRDAAKAVLDYLGFAHLTDHLIGDPEQYVKRKRTTRRRVAEPTA